MPAKKKTAPKKPRIKKSPAKKKPAPKKRSVKNTAPTLGLTAIPRVSRQALSRRNVDGSVAIMRLDNDDFFYTLDGLAAEAWLLMDGKRSLQAIHERLLKGRSLPEDRLSRDLVGLFGDLKKAKLLD